MKPIIFDIEDIKNNSDGFSYYILGRSYDLEENEVDLDYKKTYEIIKSCADEGHIAAIYDLGC